MTGKHALSQGSTQSKRIRKSQPHEDADIMEEDEEEETHSYSQFQDDFYNVLREAGVKFTSPIITVKDPMSTRKALTRRFTTGTQEITEFIATFKNIVDDDQQLKQFLLPYKRYDFSLSINFK
jgi:hypothetical protein